MALCEWYEESMALPWTCQARVKEDDWNEDMD